MMDRSYRGRSKPARSLFSNLFNFCLIPVKSLAYPYLSRLKDFYKIYEDPSISRTIKELSYTLKSTNNNIFFSSHKQPSSDELDDL